MPEGPKGNDGPEGNDSNDQPESRHRACWYGRRSAAIPPDIGFHTIEDGQLLFCAHPMWFPIVGYQFDVRNCEGCEYFRPVRSASHPQ